MGGTRSNASDLGIHTDIDTAHEKVEDLPDLKAILEEQKAMAAAANTVIETSGQIASDIAHAAAKAKADAKEEIEDKLKEAGTYEAYLALSKEKQELYLLGASSEYAEASITLEHWGVGGDYSRALSVVTNIIVGATAGQGNAQIATNAIAPYASQLIGDTFEHTDDPNKAAQLLSHAVLGAIIAYMNGGDAVSGAASATASELASMVLAKELYPEAFDEDGNLVRSDLGEEQAESIVAITNAIGALAGGITGGDVTNASIGSFIGENAVVNNRLFLRGTTEEKQKILSILQKLTNQKLYVDANGEVKINKSYIDSVVFTNPDDALDQQEYIAQLLELQVLINDDDNYVEVQSFINDIIDDKDINLYIVLAKLDDNRNGQFDPNTNSIELLNILSEAKMSDVLYHEIGHALLRYNPGEAVKYDIDVTTSMKDFDTAEAYAQNQLKNEAYAEMTRYNLYNSLTPEQQKLVVKPYDYGGKNSEDVYNRAIEYLSDTNHKTLGGKSHYEHYYSSYIDAQKGKN